MGLCMDIYGLSGSKLMSCLPLDRLFYTNFLIIVSFMQLVKVVI
jgi:hypothetical protein